mgnify:CR=1 FL=1
MLQMRWGFGFPLGRIVITLAAALAVAPSVCEAAPPERVDALSGPLKPDVAPKSFRVAPGVRLELVAAEPLVVSPVACAFDERGRLFVVEDRGYPTGPGEGKPPVGRVALLEEDRKSVV